ncbi:MAG: type IV secretion system protein VirB9 [Candidatus Deianiraeaceae bacterium]|jgi:type IV secretion system protein VirB9
MFRPIILIFSLICFTSYAEKDFGLYKKDAKESVKRRSIKARTLGHDSRFKVFPYMENGVYEVIALYDNTTYIEFDENEIVASITNPKDDSWQLLPQKNKLFLKPIASNADTQFTVMTNKRMYFFEMYAKEPSDVFDDNYTFYYQFTYPTEEEQKTIRRYSKSLLPNLDLEPEKYNFNYTITGHSSLYPLKIFDDGEFTYFEFRDRGGVIPAIFLVDSENYESLVNFRMVGSYLVVETISPRFTLRNGSDIVCVFNETLYESPEIKQGFFAIIKKRFRK